MQKHLLVLLITMLFSSHSSWSQQREQDSAWVSIYAIDSTAVVSSKFPYSSLFTKSIQLPIIYRVQEGFLLIPLKKKDEELLKLSLLDKSYSVEEIKGTALQKSLREFERLSFPYANVITQYLAAQIGLPNNGSRLVSFKGEVYQEVKKTKLLSTENVINKINKHDSVRLNKQLYLRSRLLDFVVGNHTRSVSNATWILKTKENITEVLPYIDAYDNQYMRLEGTYKLINKLLPAYKHFSNYSPAIKSIKKSSSELVGFDVNILSSLSYDFWLAEVTEIKNVLSKAVINQVEAKLPYDSNKATKELLENLQIRVDNLEAIATEYYNLISPHKIVKASHESNIIVLDRKSSGITTVRIYNEKDGKQNPIKEFSFSKKDTKSIWVYGLNGSDYYEVNGKSNDLIPLSLIGGKHLDKYEINNGKGVTIYDTKQQTNIVQAHKAKNKLSNDEYVVANTLDKYQYNKYKLTPVLGANPDDGIFFGALNTYTINGFERNPYTQKHELEGVFYLGQIGYRLQYQGEIVNLIKDNNVFMSLGYQSPNYSTNFFGFGNETPNFDDNLQLDYNRVRMSVLNARLGLVRRKQRYETSVNFFFESIKIDKTPGRFVSSETLFFPDNQFFDLKRYIGLQADLLYKKIALHFLEDLSILPSLAVKSTVNIEDYKKIATSVRSDILLSHPLYKEKVWSEVRFNYHYVFGENLEFYQVASIGGNNGLRGYRNQRFTGQSSFFANTNVKWYVKDLESDVLPLQFGLMSGFDIGRVWFEEESSRKLHTSYGAGFWLQSANLLKGSLMAFGSNEGLRFNFNLKFGF